ncbi:hypothetical protein PINS_up005020 [Pythium insidiosum]|nr:hypothetical protein PINS_up005020 [Pythium insidiosum]
MTSKLEYLQRYMSSGSGAFRGVPASEGYRWVADVSVAYLEPAATEKKLRKKVKKKKDRRSGGDSTSLRIVDEDDDWTQSAPARADIEQRWEVDAAEGTPPRRD